MHTSLKVTFYAHSILNEVNGLTFVNNECFAISADSRDPFSEQRPHISRFLVGNLAATAELAVQLDLCSSAAVLTSIFPR